MSTVYILSVFADSQTADSEAECDRLARGDQLPGGGCRSQAQVGSSNNTPPLSTLSPKKCAQQIIVC